MVPGCYCTSTCCSCRGYGYAGNSVSFIYYVPVSQFRRQIDAFMQWALIHRCAFWGYTVRHPQPWRNDSAPKHWRNVVVALRRVSFSFNRYPTAAHRSGLRTARP
jgi:hypothetical protein